jgi:hypothetical protein
MGVKITGLDQVMRNLDRIIDRASALDGKVITLADALTPEFLSKHTGGRYSSLTEWADQSGLAFTSIEDFTADERWNRYVQSTTDFASAKEMFSAATGEYAARQIFQQP